MDLNWANLRTLNGSQSQGFEELCSQLAWVESPDGAEFFRKGSPDGGVECYSRFENGEEWGWQAKFFLPSLGQTQWNQLDQSVEKALDAHPQLVRYFVCVPRDRSDGHRPGITTEMQRWETHVAKWEGWASDRGMAVEFVWWGSSELISRLSQESQSGRTLFWFGTAGKFNAEWFDAKLELALQAAGPRYTPEIHVDVPLLEDLELFGRSGFAVSAIRDVAKNLRQAPTYTFRRLADDDAADGITAVRSAAELVDKIVEALYELRCHPDCNWQLSGIMEEIRGARGLLEESEAPLLAAAEEFKERSEAEETTNTSRSNPYGDAVHQVRDLERVLWNAFDTLWGLDQAANSDLMVVIGEAGSGKTHLLCDMAKRRLADGRPTVVLMGQQFTTTEQPWIQARAQLDLGDLSLEHFVGALEAAAQAADCRALLMIDAINEGEGQAIWPPHLAGFLARLRVSPWIGVVLSVRTPYIEHVIPEEMRESAYEVVHLGFTYDTYAALKRFCEYYGLDFPATPLLRPEFDNPLFLKTLCQGLKHRGERRIPVGAEGVSRVFDRYINAIDAELATKLDYDPQGRIVAQALDAVALELIEKGTGWLPRHLVQELVNPSAPATGFTGSLYRALVDTGLLVESFYSSQVDDWIVIFGYEWFADYRIAKCLIDRNDDARSLASALVRGNTDGGTEARISGTIPLEALSVLLPERLGIELPEVISDSGTGRSIKHAFLRGLPWRDPSAIGSSCMSLIEDSLAEAQDADTTQIFDALLTCSMVPGHPLGSAFIDNWLRQLVMPDRDAVWSKYLFFAYGEGGPVDRLLDWGDRQSKQSAAIDEKTAVACATVLTWFLTSSHRFVRDRATKCLVALLTDRIDLGCDLVSRFDDVDDLYVRERLMAAAYGAAMRNTDGPALAPLANLVYHLVFAHSEPPVHILLRDYARGIIERALHLSAEIAVNPSLIDPPYHSEWPLIPDASELESLDPWREDRESELSDAEKAQSQIYSSVMSWDFARYVIGTNSNRESNDWLSVPNEDPLWQTSQERAESYKVSLAPDLQPAFEDLWTNTRAVSRSIFFGDPEMEEDLRDSDGPASSYTVNEPYIDPHQEALFTARLSEEQMSVYQDLKASRESSPPRLSLDIIQRYVLWRVFDLGWSIERFGTLDWRIYRSGIYGSGYRADHKPERIGKKYQWIAYHEILGFISDCYQYREMYEDAVPNNAYRGTWQLSVRDIDPSVVDTGAPLDEGQVDASGRWRSHDVAITPFDDIEDKQWLGFESDIPCPDQHLRFTDSRDGSIWIMLQGSETWKTPTPPGFDQYEVDRREIWLEGCGFFVDAAEIEVFMTWAKERDFWNRWMPEPPRFHSLFYGEIGWSFASNAQLGEYLKPHYPARWKEPACPIGIRPVAIEYHAEAGGYDCSLVDGYAICRPVENFIEPLNLRWTGHGADYIDSDGSLVALDLSADSTSSSALLVREDILQRFLGKTESALVWAILGEKRVLTPKQSRSEWAGSLRLTGAAFYSPDGLQGFLSSHLELPGSVS